MMICYWELCEGGGSEEVKHLLVALVDNFGCFIEVEKAESGHWKIQAEVWRGETHGHLRVVLNAYLGHAQSHIHVVGG